MSGDHTQARGAGKSPGWATAGRSRRDGFAAPAADLRWRGPWPTSAAPGPWPGSRA